jgi:uncharacterized protein YqgV (UPF0045/DUF77 family)
MQLSVELTLTPLKDDFETPIKDFIRQLRATGFKVIETPLSTQIYGEYDLLMQCLTEEIKTIFKDEQAVVLHIKMYKGNRSEYVPSF